MEDEFLLPSTRDVIGYLNRDIFELQLSIREHEKSCEKDPLTCGGCKEVQALSKAVIDYRKVIDILRGKDAVENLEGFENGHFCKAERK